MATIVKKIRLMDGSEHDTKQREEAHMTNIICREKIFDNLNSKSALAIRDYFYENEAEIVNVMQLIRELKEVEQLDF